MPRGEPNKEREDKEPLTGSNPIGPPEPGMGKKERKEKKKIAPLVPEPTERIIKFKLR